MIGALEKRIRRAFSGAAQQYDTLAGLHREIGRELTRKIRQGHQEGNILDVGMGTGWFTNRLKGLFPEARVFGVDSAAGMVARAAGLEENFHPLRADARALPLRDGALGLVTSNLAYQWVGNLPEAFAENRRVLREGGLMAMTMFGRDTFQELFDALARARELSGGDPLPLCRLATAGEVRRALEQAGFKSIRTDEERIKVRYPDLRAILKWIRDIGANALSPGVFLGKSLLARAEDYYNATYCDRLGVYTTFEVIWVCARK
jgi:malonyl-CoA O-methyltransferase